MTAVLAGFSPTTLMHPPPFAPDSAPWFVVVNAASGSHDAGEVTALIRERVGAGGRVVNIREVTKPALLAREAMQAARAARACNGLLLAVGGDGTLNAVAEAAMQAGVVFSVIPRGTFNYFGRCHGFPDTPGEALEAVLGGRLRPIQVGRINDHVFLVNASLGLYPRLLADREAFKQQWGRSRFNARISALLTIFGPQRRLSLTLKIGDEERSLFSSTVFAGNNRLQLEQIGIPEAASVEAGALVGLVLHPVGRWKMLALVLKGSLGQLGEDDDVERLVFRRLEIRPARWWGGRAMAVAVDGEGLRLKPPLVFEVDERPLWLLAPTPKE